MHLDFEVPNGLAARLSAPTNDLSRLALKAFLAKRIQTESISKSELGKSLGTETIYDLDEFLKAYDIWIKYTVAPTRNRNSKAWNSLFADALGLSVGQIEPLLTIFVYAQLIAIHSSSLFTFLR